MRVAIVHYWLVQMRGGERVLEALCDLFPEADLFTHVCDRDRLSPTLQRHRIHTSFIQRLPAAKRRYPTYLPLMPFALEQFDLRGYDLVISSESGPAKGVITDPDSLHLCYCHSPMRYLWDLAPSYRRQAGWFKRRAMDLLLPPLRVWDQATAQRVDHFLANSRFVAQRIRKYYRREATVLHPPVDADRFAIAPAGPEDFYLYLGQLVPYKRADLAVAACTALGKRLLVIGDGEERSWLEKLAGPTVQFLGRQSDAAIASYYQRCRALLFPGVEDFGIVPLEAMASGRPVIAYGDGGALETVKAGETGLFFQSATIEALTAAIAQFEADQGQFDPVAIREHALRFDCDTFKTNFQRFLTSVL